MDMFNRILSNCGRLWSACSFTHIAWCLSDCGDILSIGHNKCFPQHSSRRAYMSFHAETTSILNYIKKKTSGKKRNRNIKGFDILVVRISKTGQLAMSKPCRKCLEFMKKYPIRRVYYSIDGGICTEKLSEIQNSHVSYGRR